MSSLLALGGIRHRSPQNLIEPDKHQLNSSKLLYYESDEMLSEVLLILNEQLYQLVFTSATELFIEFVGIFKQLT